VEHLGPVVGQLGGLAGVKLRNHPGIGHDPRVRGEEPGYVLPERDPAGAERPGEKRGSEVGAAPAEGRYLAVGRAADEAGHDRHHPAREQRRQRALDAAIGAGVVRRRLPEVAVGVDEVQGVHVLCLRPGGLERGRHQPGAEAFAARGQVVGRAGRELAEQPEPLGDLLELLEHVADIAQDVCPAAAGGQEGPRHFGVARAQPRDQRGNGARLAGSGLLGNAEQRVGRPRHRGDDHDRGLLGMATDDVDGVADAGGIGQ